MPDEDSAHENYLDKSKQKVSSSLPDTILNAVPILCVQGKQEPWEKAQDLTRQAMESARTAQIKSCDAQKTYENYTRATEAAKAATDRQAQVC